MPAHPSTPKSDNTPDLFPPYARASEAPDGGGPAAKRLKKDGPHFLTRKAKQSPKYRGR